MFKFPKGLYTDVRIENVFETHIKVTMGEVDDIKERSYKAAFIRLYDGTRWYYTTTTDIENIQKSIDELSRYAKSTNISGHPLIEKLEVNEGEFLKFDTNDISQVSLDDKFSLLKRFFPQNKYIKLWRAQYVDKRVEKEFYSSKGANLRFDTQRAGFRISFEMSDGDKKFNERFEKAGNTFQELNVDIKDMETHIRKSVEFLKNSVNINPGQYTVVLSPEAAGVFAHESFGHKSEADFMIGDENMKKEWELGKKVGAEILSIVDDGNVLGTGYTPFDDEGTRSKKTYLIKNGILSGRLHNATTAVSLNEELTGNARAVSFEFEPIVRMTTTYIEPGNVSFEQLISDIKEGIYIETVKHGSGMSTFTLAPSLAYKIKNGMIAEPVKISVVSGSVFETLYNIEGLSKELKLLSFVLGGCGKWEQFPLPVGFGGPHVRVKTLNVQ
ncbi:TldD/PmbA family protein [Thermosipho ferrireducens]|uniref:TldD/PmbA family protein n=1 Tax=Thermosipho ferrireducens TaxID=2571116 RepID=A0ABX7S7T1_9BACT|nr:TldD/PmbA family protein [Thermosipho ferrireducens]QTA37682.1 TldD/PmbA family protein [Thermosipho ferrireducens]